MTQENQYLRGGFIKGTRVQLRDKSCAIEDVKIGDEVLAWHDRDTGRPIYRSVQQLLRYEDQLIHHFICIAKENEVSQLLLMAATENVRLYAGLVYGWVPLAGLNIFPGKFLENEWPSPREGLSLCIQRPQPVYRSNNPGVGWAGVKGGSEIYSRRSFYFDFQNNIPSENGNGEIDGDIYDGPDPYLEVTVYNLVIEELHSFHIGPGLLVHDGFLKELHNPQHYY